MGTVVEYVIVGVESSVAREAVEKAHAELERVSTLLWDDDPASEVFAINEACSGGGAASGARAPQEGETQTECGSILVSEETAHFLSRVIRYGLETQDGFDVTVGSFLKAYDFGSEEPTMPDTHAIHQIARELKPSATVLSIDSAAGFTLSGMRQGVRIAVGGVAKGYGVDRAVSVLRNLGITSALVNAGGDLYCLGTNDGGPWQVGIRDPDDLSSVIAAIEVVDAAVATSGDYQQYVIVDGIRYHHLLDPKTGLPARKSRSATVIAQTAERADALATGLFVQGPNGMRLIESAADTEALLIDANDKQIETTGMVHFLIRD